MAIPANGQTSEGCGPTCVKFFLAPLVQCPHLPDLTGIGKDLSDASLLDIAQSHLRRNLPALGQERGQQSHRRNPQHHVIN